MPPLDATVRVRLEEELRAELEREAAAAHRSLGSLVRAILHSHVAGRRAGRKAATDA